MKLPADALVEFRCDVHRSLLGYVQRRGGRVVLTVQHQQAGTLRPVLEEYEVLGRGTRPLDAGEVRWHMYDFEVVDGGFRSLTTGEVTEGQSAYCPACRNFQRVVPEDTLTGRRRRTVML